jgi:hypothetical protein
MGVRSGRRTRIGGQFAACLIEMLESPAYRVLSLSARRVLDRIDIELGHHGGNDNGRLPVTHTCELRDRAPCRRASHPRGRSARLPGSHGTGLWWQCRVPIAEFVPADLSSGQELAGRRLPRVAAYREHGGGFAGCKARAPQEKRSQIPPQKTKTQCGKTHRFSAGNPHRNEPNASV